MDTYSTDIVTNGTLLKNEWTALMVTRVKQCLLEKKVFHKVAADNRVSRSEHNEMLEQN